MTDRTRAEIEREITGKRRERELYVSAQGVGKCHSEIDALLDEWRQASESQPFCCIHEPPEASCGA